MPLHLNILLYEPTRNIISRERDISDGYGRSRITLLVFM